LSERLDRIEYGGTASPPFVGRAGRPSFSTGYSHPFLFLFFFVSEYDAFFIKFCPTLIVQTNMSRSLSPFCPFIIGSLMTESPSLSPRYFKTPSLSPGNDWRALVGLPLFGPDMVNRGLLCFFPSIAGLPHSDPFDLRLPRARLFSLLVRCRCSRFFFQPFSFSIFTFFFREMTFALSAKTTACNLTSSIVPLRAHLPVAASSPFFQYFVEIECSVSPYAFPSFSLPRYLAGPPISNSPKVSSFEGVERLFT